MSWKRLGIALVILFATAVPAQTSPASAQPEPQVTPPAAKPAVSADRNAFTFTSYNLQVSLGIAKHVFNVRGRVELRNDSQQPQSTIALQISSSLNWASVRLADKPLPFAASRVVSDIDHTGAVNEATVSLPAPVFPGASIELEVGYQGTIEQDGARLQRLGMPAELARRSDWDQISEFYTGVRRIGYVAWYPVALEPATLSEGNSVFKQLGEWRARHVASRFRCVIRADSEKLLIGNGMRREVADGVEFTLERMGLEGPFFAVGNFQTFDTARGRILFLTGNEEAARRQGGVLAKMEPVVSNGRAVQAQIVELPVTWTTYESGPMLLTPFTMAQEKDLQLQFIHTLTHANFYSARPWIYEGLAHFSQVVLREQQDGRKAALSFLDARRSALALAEPEQPSPNDSASSLINSTDEVFLSHEGDVCLVDVARHVVRTIIEKSLGRV
jgi:hypothetical protein